MQPLTQIGNTFIVAAGTQGLIVLDQHAAHESLLYESLMTAEPTSVELAEGFVLHLSVSQYNYVQRLQASLAALGFQLEPFGKETVLVRAVPTILHTLLRLGNLLEAFQEAMQRSTSQSSPEEEREHLAAALACRTAIRAGDPLSTAQMASLVEAVTHQRLAYACPHGRPTHVTLSLAELERRFYASRPLLLREGKGKDNCGSADRKNKRHFCASAPGACPLKPPAPPAGGHATPTALPVRPGARRSDTPRSTPDVGHTPQDGGEEGSEVSHRGKASGQAVLESRISAEDEMSPRANSAELCFCAPGTPGILPPRPSGVLWSE